MFKWLDKAYFALRDVPRRYKNLFLLSVDTALIPLSLYLAFALRLDNITPYIGHDQFWLLHLLQVVFGFLTLIAARQYRVKLHNFEINSVYQIGLSTFALFLILILLLYLFRFWAPRSVPIIFAMLFFFSSVGFRVLVSKFLNYLRMRLNKAVPVAIYGTGNTAIQVLSALKEAENREPVCFFDDSSALHGAIIGNIKVENSTDIERVVKKCNVQEIYVAMPDASDLELKAIANKVSGIGLKVYFTPTIMQLLLDHSRDIMRARLTTEDLLGREKLHLTSLEITAAYKGKTVVVTGAGGSIGSELSRQILQFEPKKLVLFDNNEFALYTISSELFPTADKLGTELVSRLGSVVDAKYLEFVLRRECAQVLFHAAAYKHVPLVEQNILETVSNNVLGTFNAASAAGKLSLEKFVLVSTDKAVRPTNIMGATKRLAELVTNSCQEVYPNSRYSVVRFGNVLGSSGSVVPLFKEQISRGGPVTVTHPNITRYFMTIPEASKLVLLAGFFSGGGDTFVLDMGEPVKIVDLAKRMIELLGYSCKDAGNPNGDIAIDFVGLRPGEKMYEELIFHQSELVETPHEKIFRVKEQAVSETNIQNIVEQIDLALQQHEEALVIRLINENVEGFHWNLALNKAS